MYVFHHVFVLCCFMQITEEIYLSLQNKVHICTMTEEKDNVPFVSSIGRIY